MVCYTEIHDNESNYFFSAIIDLETKKYLMPSFSVKVDGEEVLFWDNEKYLLETLYPYLKNKIKSDYLDDKFDNVKGIILALFDTAIKLGFFEPTNGA